MKYTWPQHTQDEIDVAIEVLTKWQNKLLDGGELPKV